MPPGAEPIRHHGPLLALLVLCLAAYANGLDTPFQFDDFVAFVDYHGAQDLTGWWAAMPGIRPLLKLSYALTAETGSGAFGYHLVNLMLHLVNSTLVYLLLLRWPGTPLTPLPALLGAAVFALHPAQTEAVTYLAGRSVSLMAFFYLAACLAWTQTTPRKWVGAVLFCAALASKETAVTLPLAMLLWHYASQPSPAHGFRHALRHTAPLWGVLLLALLAFATLPRYRHLLDFSLTLREPGQQILALIHGLAYLHTQPLLALHLNIDPDLRPPGGLTPALLAWGLLLASSIGLALAGLRRVPGVCLAVLWFFLQLAPTHSLLPRLDLANDRQLYLALIGPAWLLAAGLRNLATHAPRSSLLAGIALSLLFATATTLRNHDYRSEVALWRDTVRKSPDKPRAWNNLGYALRQQGETAMAAAAYQRALALDPGFEQARINLGVLQLRADTPSP